MTCLKPTGYFRFESGILFRQAELRREGQKPRRVWEVVNEPDKVTIHTSDGHNMRVDELLASLQPCTSDHVS